MKIMISDKIYLSVQERHYSTNGVGTIGYPQAKGGKKEERREGGRKEKLNAFISGN